METSLIEFVNATRSSDPEFESLDAEISKSLNFNHVRLIQSMRSVLKSLGVEDESGWSSFGYYSMVIDHIDVESRNRALMHPVKHLWVKSELLRHEIHNALSMAQSG